MIVRMADYGQGPQGAIDAPRFRVVEGLQVTFEDEWPAATIADLAARGHRVMKTARGLQRLRLRADRASARRRISRRR